MADRFSVDSEPLGLADVDGFRVGAAACGLKSEGPDVGVILCEEEGCGAALFTRNASRAAPVLVSRPRALAGRLRGVVVNSGNANCFTGEQGLQDAREMVALAASGLGVPEEQLLVASTGVAGEPLPMKDVAGGIEAACAYALGDGNGDLASVVVPTGAARRTASASGVIDGNPFRIAGVTKGVSLFSTGMANMFAFIVTDIAIAPEFLAEVMSSVFDGAFARLVVDREAGTNDTFCVMCSGRAGNEQLEDLLSGSVFVDAILAVAKQLAVDLAFEEEGATRLVDVQVTGATNEADAEEVARAIAESTLVRTAVHAGKPSWERVLAAAGRSGARVVESRATVRMAGTIIYDRGRPAEDIPRSLGRRLNSSVASVELDLGLGESEAQMWASSLSDGDDSALRELQEETDAVAEEKSRAKQELRDALDSNDSANERIAELEEALASREDELSTSRDALAEKTEKLKEIEWDHAKELRDTKVEIREELQADLDEANDKIAKLRAKADEGDEASDQEIQKTRQRADALESEVSDLKSRLAVKTQLVEKLKAEKPSGAAAPAPADDSRTAELESELEGLKSALALKTQLIEQMRAVHAPEGGPGASDQAPDARVKALQAELDGKNEEIKELEWEHAKALREAKRDAGEGDDSSSGEAVAELQARVQELETELEEAKTMPADDSNMALLEKVNDLQAELEEAREAGGASGGDGAVAELREELEKVRAELALKAQLVEQLQSEQPGGRSEGNASAELEAKVKELEAKLEEAKKQLAAKEQLVEQLKSEQTSGGGGDGASPDADARVKELEAKLEKAEAKLLKRAEKIAELREKIGGR